MRFAGGFVRLVGCWGFIVWLVGCGCCCFVGRGVSMDLEQNRKHLKIVIDFEWLHLPYPSKKPPFRKNVKVF